MNLPLISEADVKGKKVLVRCDFDVPIKDGEIEDDSRLISAVSTIEYSLEEGAQVIAVGHLGRPKEREDELSVFPVANWFASQFGKEISKTKLGNFEGWQVGENLTILENLRFFKGEEENDLSFADELANLGEIYVNEAFGASHRNHASIVAICGKLPHFGGFHLLKEVKILSSLLENPKRPLTLIVGGAKIETKLPLISSMHSFADYVLVGGEIAEQDEILLKEQHQGAGDHKGMLLVAEVTQDKEDVTPRSIENFSQVIEKSGSIIWNGPMGYLEKGHEDTTINLANEIISSNAYKVVGGGDTVSLLSKHGLIGKFDFVSVGGGAMLTFLSGRELPGLLALQD